ncbi:MAG: hypothetical protein HYX75_11945 [Acidobacteria bacterium]|nr:hypothetical protein [Acidobacteriota bacterium]
MRHVCTIGLMGLGMLLSSAHSANAQIATEVYLKFAGRWSHLDETSRLNPGNQVLDLGKAATDVEARVTVSDYLNDGKSVRVLFKGYSFYSSDTDAGSNRRNLARVDELFADWKADNWFLSVGKRRINWGTAMAFNPVNVIVPARDPLNPKLETEGQPIAWLSFNRHAVTTDLFFTRNYDKDWNSDLNRWGARVGVMIGDWDLSAYYFDGQAYRPTAETAGGARDGRDFERMVGLSFSGNLSAGVTLYSEIAGFSRSGRNYYGGNRMGKPKDGTYVQAVLGSYIVLGPESFLSFFNGDAGVTLEVYYNGEGYTPSERENYFEALDQALQERNPAVLGDYRFAGMNRFYVLAAYRNTFKERYTTEVTGLFSQDRSFSLQLQAQYNLSDYYAARAKLTHNQGSTRTEFGNAPLSDILEVSFEINF